MKKLSYLLSAAVLVAIFAISGCKKDDDPGLSAQDQAGVNFSGTWVVGTTGSVTFDSQDRTSDYSNFTLTVNYSNGQGSGTYSTTGGQTGASPWPQSGTWEFDSDTPSPNSFTVIRTGNETLPITVTLTETNMTLDFTFDDSVHQGSRTAAVNGNWSFSLVKQ